MGDEEFPTISRTVKIAGHVGKSLKKKGRGFDAGGKDEDGTRYEGRGGIYDRLGPGPGEAETGPQKSIEGWIICIGNLHPEISEEVIQDKFMDFGTIKNIHLNLDRQTGFVKGYALIEYEFLEEARSAVKQMNGKDILGQDAICDFAFSKKPPRRR